MLAAAVEEPRTIVGALAAALAQSFARKSNHGGQVAIDTVHWPANRAQQLEQKTADAPTDVWQRDCK